MDVVNERFPHWCRIVRKASDDPLEDEENFSPLDDERNDSSSSSSKVIYEGKCRSYKINTTSDKGVIITSERGLALPLNQDGWKRLGRIPMEGDEIIVTHGNSFEEYGRVVDKNVANASFGGTHLVWRYGRT